MSVVLATNTRPMDTASVSAQFTCGQRTSHFDLSKVLPVL